MICSDKTGTLTENRMTLTRLALHEGDIDVPADENGAFRRGGEEIDPKDRPLVRRALEVAVLCNAASLDGSEEDERGTGDPMEVALLVGGLPGRHPARRPCRGIRGVAPRGIRPVGER